MKTYIINQNETDNYYLIPKEKAIWLTEQPKKVDLNELINERKLTDVKIFRYNNIKEFVFNDSDLLLSIEFKDDDTDELELNFDTSSIYEDLKYFLINNLKDINVKDYSLFKQLKPSTIGILIIGALTAFLYNIAISLQNGETIRTTGRRGLIKKIFVAVADFLGPFGCLIVGGILLSLLIFNFVNTIRNPKEGKVIKFKKNTEL